MERMKAIVSDADLPEVFFSIHHALEDDYWPRAAGFHDDESVEPHIHWSILTIEDGVVVDWDWGYHSETEARSYILRDDAHGRGTEP
jgi:hypothetical protein